MKNLFILLIVIASVARQSVAQNKKLDSLWAVYNNKNEVDTNRLKAIHAVANTYLNNKPDTAIILAEQELQLAQTSKQKKYEANANNIIGVAYKNKAGYSKAIEYQLKALKLYEETGNKKGMGNCYGNMGLVYWYQADYPKALDYQLKALQVREEIGDKKGIGSCYTCIGAVYYSQLNYAKAIEYYLKALKINEEMDNKSAMADCYGNMGLVYFAQADYPKALDCQFKSLKLREGTNDKQGLSSCYNNTGNIYKEQGDYPKALSYFVKALQIKKEIGNKQGIGNSYDNMGELYIKTGNYKLAIQYCDSALQTHKETGYMDGERLAYQSLASAYSKTGRYKEAYENHIKFKQITDSIFNADNSKQLGDMKTKLEVEKKESELRAEEEVHEAKTSEEKKIQTFIIYVVAGVLILVLIFSVFLYNRFTLINKQNKIIEAKSKELERLSIVARETENSILILDADGTLDWVNTSFERLNGCGLEEFKKKYGNTIYELSNNPEIRNIIQNSIATKKSVRYESSNKLEDGRIVWEASTLTPIFNADGELTKLIIIDNDITDRKHKEEIIKEKNKDIIDSITYAKRIQQAVLKEEEHVSKHLPEHFVLFKPKDIVSGDFHWGLEKGNYFYVTAADCTGHGVPGAFLTLLGTSYLNELNAKEEILTPAEILNQLRNKIVKELSKDGITKDGMDISLARINLKTKELVWAGAYNPLLYIENGKLKEIKADKQPIGYTEVPKPFTDHVLHLNTNDTIYLFTDGYADQFGGEKGKKFKYKQLEELLVANSSKELEEQKQILLNTFDAWKGDLEQVDDVTIIGIKL
jgi:PAS domain S-box-containing protein